MTYQEYLDGKPVVVTAALTGGIHGKETHPGLPETPEEIAAAAAACEEAGAAIVHLHARRDNGERAFSTERFQAVTDAVRDATDDLVIQHSTGGTAAPDALRAEPLRTDPAPEMASLDMGPMNRGRRLTSENTRDTIDGLHAEMRERGIKPELEVFNDGHLNESFRILDDLADPPYLNLIFGPGTLSPPSPANLQHMVDQLPDRAEFNVIGFGPHQLPLTTQSLLLGGHVRVGLEDNSYYRKGERATNEALVARSVRIAEELGRPVASPAEARDLLGL
ncbi:3-keto-5-aminohexanoate cleavage protein [Halorarum halophilum]|uniref:3-keto-5-aminohexanoate cleavage protein n=1 Tax=Halorarum halophilum TaxID=2743090 RepID=A0A7D5GW24_9EURY|nr:3-keto-5-aminohexanoate cleavage protein [Halobaculum halophilum]QLG26609.1 3-keto-5-aminohexanoate cleavage protein [Halobaculum halophilum]